MIVGISGAFCDNNFGDYTMLINNIYDLTDAHLGIEKFIVFCYDTSLVANLKKDYLNQLNVELVEVKSTEKVELSPHFFGIDNTDKLHTPLEILQTISNLSEIKERVQEVDLMISNGGGYYDYYWLGAKRRYRLYSIVAPLILGRQLNKKVITLGNSYGPWGRNSDFFFGLFNYINFDAIDCRDNLYSRKYLNQISVFDNIYEVSDDLVEINNDLRPQKKVLEGLKYFVIDLYSSIQDIEHNIEYIIEFVEKEKKERQLTPVVVAHGPDYNGTRQGALLKQFIPDIIVFKSETDYLRIEDFLSLIRGAEFVLCEHYHTFVISLTNKTPAIMFIRTIDGSSYYYYNKSVGFIKNSGLLEGTGYNEGILCATNIRELFDGTDIDRKLLTINNLLKNHSFESKKINYIRGFCEKYVSGGV
jgi:polysaccharide pyruvyl transferase WcaK-like protein